MQCYSLLLPDHKPGWLEAFIAFVLIVLFGAATILIGAVNSIPWFVDLLLVIAFSLFAASLFDLPNAPALFLAFYLLFFANIVLVSEIGSLLGLLGSRLYFFFAHLVLAGFAMWGWLRKGKPALLAPLDSSLRRINWRTIVGTALSNPVALLLALAVFVVYGVGLYLVFAEPQNSDDLLTTYLARVGYWLQNGSLNPWPVFRYNFPQVTYPPNAQFLMAWSVLFWRSELPVGLTQWTAVCLSMVGIYGLARLLGASRWQGVVSALFFATFSEIVLHSTKALFDITTAALLLSVVYFFFLGSKINNQKVFWLSGMAVGIAVGTKQTIFFAFPGLAVVFGLFWFSGDRLRKRIYAKWIPACALSVLFLGTYSYIQNLIYFDNPLGSDRVVETFTASQTAASFKQRLDLAGSNLGCMGLFAAFGDLPETLVEDWDFQACPEDNHRIEYDTIRDGAYAWYGPVGLVLFIIAIGYGAYIGFSKRDWYFLGLIAIIVTYTIVLAFVRRYNSSNSRYMIPVVALAMSIAALTLKKNELFVIAVLISVYFMGYARIYDGSKPLIGEQAVGTVDRISRISYDNLEEHETMLRVVEKNVPEDAVLGIIMPGKAPHSPLFGEHYTRTILPYAAPLSEFALIDAGWLRSRSLDYLLIETVILQYDVKLADDLKIIPIDNDYLLLTFPDE